MKKSFLPTLLVLSLFCACKKEKNEIPEPVPSDYERFVAPYLKISEKPLDFRVSIPSYVNFIFSSDQPNNYKAQLGRVIFYDSKLSKDGKVACASCHHPELAFADDEALSLGFNGQKTKRNSMALANTFGLGPALGMDSTGNMDLYMFWDLRAATVSAQSKAAFENPVEMNMPMPEVVAAMKKRPFYGWLFEQAWGDSSITEQRIFESLSNFMAGLGVQHSKFDQALEQAGGPAQVKEDFAGFSAAENRGKSIFIANCESCHGSLVSMTKIFEANNGLDNPIVDPGKGGVSGLFYEKGIFKVPGLRNIALSAPYMHDGRFKSLDQVVEHYNSGVKKVFGLHGDLLTFNPANGTYSAKRLNLSLEDKAALVQFLNTLSDPESLKVERYSNPFK